MRRKSTEKFMRDAMSFKAPEEVWDKIKDKPIQSVRESKAKGHPKKVWYAAAACIAACTVLISVLAVGKSLGLPASDSTLNTENGTERPVAKLICASNENKVLYDFFTTGEYDKNREFILTNSPSMDILISSNLERLIYRIAGNDANKNAQLMASLAKEGKYTVTPDMKAQLSDFYGNYTSEKETAEVIKKLYEDTGYVIDTHTAVAAGVYGKYKEATGDTATKTVIASTASPFKFTRSVMDAIDPKYDSMTDFELVDELSKLGNVKVPNAIEEIRDAKILHNTVCDVDQMENTVKKMLGVQ